MRHQVLVFVAILSIAGVALADGPLREWVAEAPERGAVLRLMANERDLLAAEKRLEEARKIVAGAKQLELARAAHDAEVRETIAAIASRYGASAIAPDLRPDGKVVFREIAAVTSR